MEGLLMIKRLSFILFVLSLGYSCVPVEVDEDLKSDVQFEDLRVDFGIAKGDGVEARRAVRFGDRYFVESVLENAFGESVKTSWGDQSYNLIFKRQGVFGGGCDLYERNYEETGSAAGNYRLPEKRQNCFDENRITDQVGNSTVIRSGYMVKFCEYTLSKNNTARNFAYNKANIDPDSTEINPQNFQRLYQLFYPNRSLASTSQRVLKDMESGTDLAREESWDVLLMALCVSPDWQIP